MPPSREGMPPKASGTAEPRVTSTAFREGAGRRVRPGRRPLRQRLLRRLRLSAMVQRRERWIRIPRYQTAELWMVPGLKDRRLQPMAYTCPMCSEKEDTRLLSVVLQTSPTSSVRRSRAPTGRVEHPRILLRITRSQLNDITAEFARPPPAPRKRRTDRETVLGSLV